MPDVLDEAADKETREREALTARARRRADSEGPLTHCAVCGEPIPEGRRTAAPGAKRCIGCQEDFEGA